MRDDVNEDRDARRVEAMHAMRQRWKAHFAENCCWVIAGLVLIQILQTQWKPQSDWTIAIKWIVLMSPIYYVIWSAVRIVRMVILKDDEHGY